MRLLAVLCLLASLGIAQSNQPETTAVRVCVAMPSNLSHLAISPVAQRERMIQEINRDGRKGNVKVEAVGIAAGDSDDLRASAKEQDCRIIVSLRFETSVGYVPRNDDPMTHQPPITQGGTLVTRRASLEYSIARSDNTGGVDEGGIPLRAGGDDSSAANDAVSRVSPRVVHDAAKSKP